MFKNKIIILSYFIICTITIDASDYYFKRISIEEGLSQPGINSIMRDHHGTLWIATRLGLNKIARNEIKSYFYHSNDQNSLSGNYIYKVCEDDQRNLWIVTNGGLSLYNNEKDNFDTKLTGRIRAITPVEDGVLFGGFTAIYHFSYDTKEIERLPLKNNDKTDNHILKDYLITYLKPINDTIILVGTETEGIFTYNRKSYEFFPLINDKIDPLSAVLYDSERNEIYLSILQDGLRCYALDGVLKRHYTTKNSSLSNNIILDLEKHDGKVWIATDGGGIDILNRETEDFTNYHHIPGDINSLPVNSITVLYSDNNDNLWAGTVRDGVFLFKETYIKTYKDITLGSNKGLSEKAVISLYEDKNKDLWIGTDGGGINKFDAKTETFTHHLKTYGDKVVSITDYAENLLLVSLYGKGVFIYNTIKQEYIPFTIIDEKTNEDECFSGFVPFCHKISSDKLLILAKNAYMYNPEKHQFRKLYSNTEPFHLHALQLVFSDNDRSFMTKGNTVYTLENKGDLITELLVLDENEYVNSVCYEKSKNRLWIASTGGLMFYDINTEKLSKIETNLFSQISYMYLDINNRLWINASNMLFSYDIKTEKFMIWDDSDGFLPNDILTYYVKPSSFDYIYMGGTNGLVRIDKNIDYEVNPIISFMIQDIEWDGKLYPGYQFYKNKKISIPENYSSLKIRVNLNEKDLFRNILFRFRINSEANNSIVESYSNMLNLTSLGPGAYSIYVSCMTKSGNWTEEFSLIAFEITPPFYKRSWFIIGLLLMIISIASLVMLQLMKRDKRRLRWKMAMHQQELNEDKIHFLTNVSHELRTPLTLIYAPLKRILDNAKGNEISLTKNQLENVFRQANHMKGIINWVLEYDKNTRLSQNMSLSFFDINQLIKSVVNDFAQEFGEKFIKINLELDESLVPLEMDDTKIKVVISNLIMNALKFSDPESKVIIRTFIHHGLMRVEVEDEGIGLEGIDTNKLFTRFYQGKHERHGSGIGLAYCKDIIETHRGRIGAKEHKPKGTIVFFELPYQVESSPNFLPQETENKSALDFFAENKIGEQYDLSSYIALIVDDNKDFKDYLESELKPLFKKLFIASDGKEALDITKNIQPDIIISDVMMPIMNGYEFCKAVKEQIEISHIPIILLTAKGDIDSQKLGYKLGADSYISKPFDIELLISVIRNQLSKKETIKQRYLQNIIPLDPELSTSSNSDEMFLKKLNAYIKMNFHKSDFDVRMVVDHMAMSRASLYNKMKNVVGLGLSDYINKFRIAAACVLLEQTEKTIADIAFETGFTSQGYFSTAFKLATGKSPSLYRLSKKR